MNTKIRKTVERTLIGGFIALIGMALIFDWKIAVGVFLMIWGNNITNVPDECSCEVKKEDVVTSP